MLSTIEQRVTAVIADAMATRAHLSVFTAPGPSDAIAAGKGRMLVALREISADAVFQREEFATAQKSPPRSRRVLPVQFAVDIRMRTQPAEATPAAVLAARTLLLDDMSLTVHALNHRAIRGGETLAVAGDPGFDVLSFALDTGSVGPDLVDGALVASLRYKGTAEIWPPQAVTEEFEIKAVDVVTLAQPVTISATPARVAAGGTSRIRVQSIDGKRLLTKDAPREPLHLAVRIVSDFPPERRGAITSGTPGKETGVRIVTVAGSEVVFDYRAPTAPLGVVHVEFVAVHLATPDDHMGSLLGTTALPLVETA